MKLWQLVKRVSVASLRNAMALFEFPASLDKWIRTTYAGMKNTDVYDGMESSGSFILRTADRNGYSFGYAEVRHHVLAWPVPVGSFTRTLLTMNVDTSALRNSRVRMADSLLAVLLSIAAMEKNKDPEAFVQDLLAYHTNDEGVVVRYVGKRMKPMLPEGIAAIGDYAFLGAPIERIGLPSSCTSIGHGAFYGCSCLSQISLPKTLKTIGRDAFHGCERLRTVRYPGTDLVHIGANAFRGTPWLEKQRGFIALNHILIAFHGEPKTEFVIPEGIRAIVDKAEFCFMNAEEGKDLAPEVERLILPDSMRELGVEAFCFPRLRYVDLGGTECIQDRCFFYCDDLFADDDVNAWKYLCEDGEIDEEEEETCDSMIVTNGRRVQFAGEAAFTGDVSFVSCSKILTGYGSEFIYKKRRFEVREGCRDLENLVFKKQNIDVVYIPGSVEKIRNCVFEDGVIIETPFFSAAQLYAEEHRIETCVRLGNGGGFPSLKEYVEKEELLEQRTYTMVTGLVYSDHENTAYFDELVRRCPNLREFKLPRGTEESCYTVDGVLFSSGSEGLPALIKFPPGRRGAYSVPEGIEHIHRYAFENAQLSEVHLPEGLIWIGEMAFCGSRLTHLHIPSTVVSIGENNHKNIAGNCQQLRSIRVSAGNSRFFDYDGVLFDAESSSLLCFPAGRTETKYEVPNFCRGLGWQSFAGCRNLKEIVGSEQMGWHFDNNQFLNQLSIGCTTLKATVSATQN